MEVPAVKENINPKFQILYLIVGKISALIATFAIPLILTRLLSKSEYGIFAQFYVVLFFCTEVFNLSMQSSLYYYYPNADVQKKKSLVIQTLFLLFIAAIFAVSLLSISWIGNSIIGKGDLLEFKKYILFGVVLFMPLYILEPLYVVKKDVFISLIYPPLEVLLRLSVVVAFFVIHPGLHAVFTGVLASATICLIFVLGYTFKDISFKDFQSGIFKKEIIKEQLVYCIPFGLAVSLNILFQRFDKIICISFLTSSEYAIYAIAFFGIPGILHVFDSLSQVYLIQMTIKHKENKTAELGDLYKKLVSKTSSFTIPILLVVFLYAEKIIVLLFTRSYIDAVPLFRVYLVSVLIFMLCPGLILRATGKTRYTLRSYIQSAFFVLPLTYILIRFFGVWGAMTGALVSIGLPRILNLIKEIRLTGSSVVKFFPWMIFMQIIFISSAIIVPFATFEYLFDYKTIIAVLLGVVYILTVFLVEMKMNLLPLDTSLIKRKIAWITIFFGFGSFKKYLPFI
jgi:O-antigen/teichoic acid export membrane protein